MMSFDIAVFGAGGLAAADRPTARADFGKPSRYLNM